MMDIVQLQALLLQEKNVGSDMLEGKVGRIYMPNQMIDTMPQHKMKVRGRCFSIVRAQSTALSVSICQKKNCDRQGHLCQ